MDSKEYRRRNAYVVSDQGKPPDLVMEIASRWDGTGGRDGKGGTTYAAMGIGEYWRFDETGEISWGPVGGGPAGGWGRMFPVEIEELPDGEFAGGIARC